MFPTFRVLDGGCEASLWWRNISSVKREEWFHDHVSRLVENGKHTLFWWDVRVGDVSFKDKFSICLTCHCLRGSQCWI